MKTITFYSYKGGVGRSLALANIASRLVEFGRSVCLLDFDLEAPGLHFKFLLKNSPDIKKGIVDYIFEFTNSGSLPKNINDYCVQLPILSTKKAINCICAGDISSKEYWQKLSAINWSNLLYNNSNGIAFLLDLKEKIRTQIKPDYLLIDSRTGISEMSGITLSLLADEIVIVAANNRENLYGCHKVIESILSPDNIFSEKSPKINFVLSRIPFTDNPVDKAKEQVLLSKIKRDYGTLIEEISVIHSDRELEEDEKLKIGYEKDASTAQIARDYLNLFERVTNGDFTPEEIQKFNNLKKAEAIFSKAINSKLSSEKINLISSAIDLNPSNLNFYLFRAVEYHKNADFAKAKLDLTTILTRVSTYFPALQILADINYKERNFDEARRIYNLLLTLQPGYALANLGLGLISSEEENLENALLFYNRAIEAYPEDAQGLNLRAHTYKRMGKYDLALSDIYKSLELDPSFAPAFATLAEINAEQGKIFEFYLNLELALKLDAKKIEPTIAKERTYRRFVNEERFQKLLEKYSLSVLIFLDSNSVVGKE